MAHSLSEVGYAHENTCRKVGAARPVLARGGGHGIGNADESRRTGFTGCPVTVKASRQPVVERGQRGR